jgi:hypothetical protein
MTTFLRRVGYWLRGRRAAEELEQELQFHREMAEHDLRADGVSASDAQRAVRRTMGNTTLAREDARAQWVAPWVDALWQDIRHGMRSLRRSPGLVVVSALSLGLGIGLNTILFMVLSAVYGHEPTMVDPKRVVGVEPGYANQFSYQDYRDLKSSGIFADALGFRAGSLNMGTGGRLTPTGLLVVTANFFDLLGVRTQLGRTFTASEAAPERNPRLAVVTAPFWRARLRGDATAIGETLVLGGESFTVVGVLPDDNRAVFGWIGPQIYVPVSRLTLPAIDDRGTPSLSVLARLQPDATASQALTAVTGFVASLERAYPERLTARGRSARVFPAQAMQFRGAEMGYNAARTLMIVTWRPGAPDRVRQCRGTADGPRDRTSARDCRPRGDWCRTRPRRAGDADREPAAGDDGCRARSDDGVCRELGAAPVGNGAAAKLHSAQCAPRHIWISFRAPDHAHLRCASRAQGDAGPRG